jgi:anaerobic C4-dicarboxylate transporter
MILLAIVAVVLVLAVSSAPSHQDGTATAGSDAIGIIVMLFVAAVVFVVVAGAAGVSNGKTFSQGVEHFTTGLPETAVGMDDVLGFCQTHPDRSICQVVR